MAITRGKKIAAGASAAGLVVALTAAITPSAFAADDDYEVSVEIGDLDPAIIAGAPKAESADVDNLGVPQPGTWQFPGNGKATVTFGPEAQLANSDHVLAGRVTVEGNGLGDAWEDHDVATENRYDFWFRFRDYELGQGGQYKGDDFRQVDSNTLEMVSSFGYTELGTGVFLDNADIQLLSNLDWTGNVTVTIEFLSAPSNLDRYDYSEEDVTILGVGSFSRPIIPAIEISEQPEDVTAEPGDDVTFKSSAVSNTNPSLPNHAPNHIEQDDIDVAWAVSPDGGSTWDGIHNVEDTTLAVSGVTGSQDGFLYIAAFSAGDDNFNVESNPAELTVKAAVEEEPKDEEPAEPSNGKSPSYTG